MMVVSFTGCSNHEAEKIHLQAQIDSLENVNKQVQDDLTDMQKFVGVLAEGLDSIAQQEDILFFTNKGREGVAIDREQLKHNLKSFEDMLARQKKRIAQLTDSLNKRGEGMESLSALVEHLNKQIEEKDATIKQLKADLDKKNVDIKQLTRRVKSLTDDNDKLTSKVERQKEALTVQTEMINECYVKIGTKQELKAQGIISAGFLKKTRVNTDGLKKENCMRVDIRTFTELEIESGSVKVLTPMPSSSYKIVKDNQAKSTLYILDPTAFWSVSNYLVILK